MVVSVIGFMDTVHVSLLVSRIFLIRFPHCLCFPCVSSLSLSFLCLPCIPSLTPVVLLPLLAAQAR